MSDFFNKPPFTQAPLDGVVKSMERELTRRYGPFIEHKEIVRRYKEAYGDKGHARLRNWLDMWRFRTTPQRRRPIEELFRNAGPGDAMGVITADHEGDK